GSRGSVIPIFKEQIRKGGPVMVTHPEMKRYFMITSEAALLVLQAGAIGEGGEVFILDMGERIKIVDLARELIRLSGYEPDVDIPITFTGIRPGEKFLETLFTEDEDTLPTEHKKIFVVKMNSNLRGKDLSDCLGRLDALAERGDSSKIVELLREMVPGYHPMDRELPTTGRET
ncbi:polysaccharide biosynthesis protein, partial [Candidatus Aerophobetes bacterium]